MKLDFTNTNDCPCYNFGLCISKHHYGYECDYNLPITMYCEYRERQNLSIYEE